ncbi:MAG TPA: FUSC family protein [Microlunatus sp.]|nr:FUSC family protein [Microlunatus sp.]
MSSPDPAPTPEALPALRRMSLRAYDLSERTARRGRESLEQRWARLRSRAFIIVQIAITAGLAWFVAETVLGHRMPFFAPVAAIVTLGVTFGQRIRRGVEVAIGVAVGVLVGDLFVTVFGSGVWQLTVVIALAMSIATLLGAGQLMIIQSGVQSAIIVTLVATPGYAFDRWVDAVVGAAIALIMATIAPSAPLRKPRLLAAEVLDDVAATLEESVRAMRAGDADAADAVLDHARRTEQVLGQFSDAAREGLAVVRHSPFRRRELPTVMAYADLYGPLDHASRNLRVLARRCVVSLWRHETVPENYLDLMSRLAEVARFMTVELRARRLPTNARERLVAVAKATSRAEMVGSLSAMVVLAQVRSMTADLLELTGMDYADARELIPDMD